MVFSEPLRGREGRGGEEKKERGGKEGKGRGGEHSTTSFKQHNHLF